MDRVNYNPPANVTYEPSLPRFRWHNLPSLYNDALKTKQLLLIFLQFVHIALLKFKFVGIFVI